MYKFDGWPKLNRTTASKREGQRIVPNGRETMIDSAASEDVINDANLLQEGKNIDDLLSELTNGAKATVSGKQSGQV